MPFVSQAQERKFIELVKAGKMQQKTYDEWRAKTPDLKKLPERKASRKWK
jgi:hypothetical protein